MAAHVVTCTGWTWDYVEDQLDIPRLAELSEYWRAHPPLHLMVAEYLDFKPKPRAGTANDPGEIERLFGMLPMEK